MPRDLLLNPLLNRGTNFPLAARDAFGLRGLLPPVVESSKQQVERVMLQLRGKGMQPLDKYLILNNLAASNLFLFYQVLMSNLEELMPVVYTPTVGAACLNFHTVYTRPQGLYLSGYDDRGSLRSVVANCHQEDVRIIVITDGGRILGLGDLGTNGMGISVGKIALYVAGGGFSPDHSLPVVLDCGTNRKDLLESNFYLGTKRPRIQGKEHLKIVEEACEAIKERWPRCLIQFEDFQTDAAFAILERMRGRCLCFNDDIQGTGAIVLAGLINGLKVQGTPLSEARIVFYGAGSSACGVAAMIVQLLQSQGLSEKAALEAIYMVDTKGLITATRPGKLPAHKVPFARKDGAPDTADLGAVIAMAKPHALIGLAGAGPAWSRKHVEQMCQFSGRPLVFPLSNPTSQAEVSARDAYQWSDGKCIFASGSPFDPVEHNGKMLYPGQCNNVFIFPGLGFGAVSVKATAVADEFLLAAARAVAEEVPQEMLEAGRIYPELKDLRSISLAVATKVAQCAIDMGLSELRPPPENLQGFLAKQTWSPHDLSTGAEAALSRL